MINGGASFDPKDVSGVRPINDAPEKKERVPKELLHYQALSLLNYLESNFILLWGHDHQWTRSEIDSYATAVGFLSFFLSEVPETITVKPWDGQWPLPGTPGHAWLTPVRTYYEKPSKLTQEKEEEYQNFLKVASRPAIAEQEKKSIWSRFKDWILNDPLP